MGKFTAGASERSPASMPMEDLSWQLLGASLAACGAASPVSRARLLQGTRESESSTSLRRSFRKGCVKPPLLQQPPLHRTHSSCSGEGTADLFFHSKMGKVGRGQFFFFSFFFCFLMHKRVLIHFNSRFSHTAISAVSQTAEKDSLCSYLTQNIAAQTFSSAL